MANNADFLKAYRSLESAVKSIGFESVLSYEATLEKEERDTGKHDSNLAKIRLCRQCRNFLSHEAGEFFEADRKMTQFLSDYAGKLSLDELPVKKFACKTFVTEETKVQDALQVILKRKTQNNVPVVNKTGEVTGYLSYEVVCVYLSKNNVNSTTKVKALMGTKGLKGMFSEILDTTPVKELDSGKTYLVKDGKGKVTGWY